MHYESSAMSHSLFDAAFLIQLKRQKRLKFIWYDKQEPYIPSIP